MLGEFIQTMWNAIQGNTKVKTAPELQSTSDTTFHSAGLPQGEAYLGYRENKLVRGERHISMLTADMNAIDAKNEH